VRPFVFEGAEEALELAVPARRVRRDADVAGAELVERLREPVAGVALGVVAEDGLDRTAALLAQPGGGAREGDGDVDRVLGAVQLGVDQGQWSSWTAITTVCPNPRARPF
jgi:hypothetical protein